MEPRLFEDSLTAYRVRTELLGVSAYTAGQTTLINIAATSRRRAARVCLMPHPLRLLNLVSLRSQCAIECESAKLH